MNEYILDYIDLCSKAAMTDSFNKKYLIDEPLSYKCMDDAIVAKHGICNDDNDNDSSAITHYVSGNYIYLGEWLSIWGHCITDNLKKLWAIKRVREDNPEKEYKLCAAKITNAKFSHNFKELISKLGINFDEILFVEQPTKFECLTVPDDSMIVIGDSRYYYQEFAEIANTIRDTIPVDNSVPDKIYFSRTKIKNNHRDYGEKEVEETFRELGYTILYPELLDLDTQLRLLRNCKYFACTEGSIAHNVIFCGDGVNIVIVRKVCGLISYQFTLNEIRKAKTIYIDTFLTPYFMGDFWNGPFLLCRRDNLLNFAKEQSGLVLRPHLSKRAFVRYINSLVIKSLRRHKMPNKSDNFNFYKQLMFKNIISKS